MPNQICTVDRRNRRSCVPMQEYLANAEAKAKPSRRFRSQWHRDKRARRKEDKYFPRTTASLFEAMDVTSRPTKRNLLSVIEKELQQGRLQIKRKRSSTPLVLYVSDSDVSSSESDSGDDDASSSESDSDNDASSSDNSSSDSDSSSSDSDSSSSDGE